MAIDLKEQIGPLPLGAWIVVVAGGLGVAYYTRNASVGSTPEIVEDVSNPPGVGEGPGWIAVPPPTTPPPGPAQPQTNEEWGRLAINWLIAQGYSPGESDAAIRNYLEVKALTNQQYALLQAALRQFGSPPIPLPSPPPPPVIPAPVTPPPTTPPATPKPPTTPKPPSKPALRYIVITPWPTQLSTLWGIAAKYYGKGSEWPRIYNVNRVGYTRPDGSKGWISNPNLIYAGRTVWVP